MFCRNGWALAPPAHLFIGWKLPGESSCGLKTVVGLKGTALGCCQLPALLAASSFLKEKPSSSTPWKHDVTYELVKSRTVFTKISVYI